jgi:hypothetical protein
MPGEFHCNFPYTVVGTLSGDGFGLASGASFRLNSLFDPVVAAGGAQPLQYDQIVLFYQRYRVVQATVHVRFFDPDGDGLVVGYRIRPATDTIATTGSTLAYLSEMLWTKTQSISNTGSQKAEFSGIVPMHTVFGVPDAQLRSAAEFSAYYNANPANAALIDVFCVDPAAGSATVRYQLSISFKCIMSERLTQVAS